MRYLITLAGYGGRLHGDERGCVDRNNNVVGGRFWLPMRGVSRLNDAACFRTRMFSTEPPGKWCWLPCGIIAHTVHGPLLAAHVRSTHVHVIVDAEIRPERILSEVEAYASRALNSVESDASDRKRWARHGSTRWIWNHEELLRALRYVIEEQGEPMELFVADEL